MRGATVGRGRAQLKIVRGYLGRLEPNLLIGAVEEPLVLLDASKGLLITDDEGTVIGN